MTARNILMSAAGGTTDSNYIEDVFSTYLYTGTGSTQTITNGIDLAGKGGLVWIKCRSAAYESNLYDTARGVSSYLVTSQTSGGAASSDFNSFNASGFTLNTPTTTNNLNRLDFLQASWTFRKQPKFFDVVTYTGTGSARTIAHNLSSVPGCIIIKRTDTSGSWFVYHRSLSIGQYAQLNGLSIINDSVWNNTAPTSSVFSVGTEPQINASGGTYVAYIYAHNAGGFGLTGTDNVISCGSFTSDGSATTVTLGYEPQWLMVKDLSSNQWFQVFDNMRGLYAPTKAAAALYTGSSDAENAFVNGFSINSTGFTVAQYASTYIYIAIRRPMKVPTDATKVYSGVLKNGSANSIVTTGFPVDLTIATVPSKQNISNNVVWDRLRGTNETAYNAPNLKTNTTAGDQNTIGLGYDRNTSIIDGFFNANFSVTDPIIYWNFKRAPSFFDQVCYTGNAVTNTARNHNLGVEPELIIFKGRSLDSNWPVYCKYLNNSTSQNNWQLRLNQTAAQNNNAQIFGNQLPTSTLFYTAGNNQDINFSGETYLAYLFASCPGVSKVGSYTGNGSTQTINCGFTAGVRFVLIKRISTTGQWNVFDTARGITSGNDPVLALNSDAAQVTSLNLIENVSAGFNVIEEPSRQVNSSGETYIYLAIA